MNINSVVISAGQLAYVTDNGSTSYCGNSLDPSKEFRIMSNTEGPGTGADVGRDPLVNYNLPYTPTELDSTITKSIRLGNCGTSAKAEALFYTMNVTPYNSLLTMYYAIVVQAPGHGFDVDPTFVIRVTRETSYGSGTWQQISDTLCYIKSSYEAENGVDGWHSYGDSTNGGLYRDWNKTTINLSAYIYERIRIEIYISDCAMSGHYGYCYVAGDCQRPELSISGCNVGATQESITISAPKDLINYVWYKSNIDGRDINSMAYVPDTVGFTQLTPDSSTNNTYTCTLNDFIVIEGDSAGLLTNNMVFRCDMTTAMDPAKPFVTKYYVRVLNHTPIMAIDTSKTCQYGISLSNQSYILISGYTYGCDIDSTKWWFYNNSQTDSAVGGQVSYHFDSTGLYNIKVRSFYLNDHSCYTDSTYSVLIDNLGSGPFACDTVYSLSPYTWHDSTYYSSGIYTFTYVNPQGCFNVDTLCLIITSDTITVTVLVNPTDGGIVTGAGIFAPNNTCTLTAIPDSGFAFSNWTDGTAILSTSPTFSFTVSSNLILTANFFRIQPDNPACPDLKNPLSFTSGSTSGTYIGYYSGQIGNKILIAPNPMTGETGINLTNNIIPASQLANTSGTGSSSYCCNSLDPNKRFRIMYDTDGPGNDSLTGKDPLVNYNLPYCPTSHDPTITHSIRLGNCETSAEAEALYYTMEVKPQNALLSLYYAIVVQSPGHGIEGDPSFIVRVTRETSPNSDVWQQISDTLFYTIPTSYLTDGVDGWHRHNLGCGGGIGFYHDWDRINILLNNYLYEKVRIEIYMSDCANTGHYGYCYIAGDCRPMESLSSGCIAGSTQEVASLTAPAGMANYVWYKCDFDGQNLNDSVILHDTISFSQLTPDNSTNNTYTCSINDFLVTQGENAGQMTDNMVFRCDITSAMDPTKPYVTKLYSRVINNKPLMVIDTVKTCEGGLTLSNLSYVPNNADAVDTAITQWWFFFDNHVDSATGSHTSYQFDTTGIYDIKVRSFNHDDHSCYADSTYSVNIRYDTGTFASLTVNTPSPYIWHGQTYTTSGTYTYDYVDSNSCPSTDTLHLSILENCIIHTSNLPYFDNFDAYASSTEENTRVEPPCWQLAHQDVTITDEYKPTIYDNPETAHSGNYCLFLSKRGIYALPYIDTNIRDLILSFYLTQPQHTHQLQVGVISETDIKNTFLPFTTINNSSTSLEYIEVDLSSYEGNGHYIAFRNTLASDNSDDFSYNYIDDIKIEKRPSQIGIDSDNSDIQHNLTLHPNPTTGRVTIEMSNPLASMTVETYTEVVRVEVFDYTGRNVATFQSQTTLDLSRLASGLYTLRVTLPERIEVRRVVKQ